MEKQFGSSLRIHSRLTLSQIHDFLDSVQKFLNLINEYKSNYLKIPFSDGQNSNLIWFNLEDRVQVCSYGKLISYVRQLQLVPIQEACLTISTRKNWENLFWCEMVANFPSLVKE